MFKDSALVNKYLFLFHYLLLSTDKIKTKKTFTKTITKPILRP